MFGVEFKQFSRTYPGNYNINFPLCLSASNDFKVKNYSNFNLTNNYKFSDIFQVDSNTFKANYIFGPISYNGIYIEFLDIDPFPYAITGNNQQRFNYGSCRFNSIATSGTNLTLAIFPNNKCQIFFTKDYKDYYLSTDINNSFSFVYKNLLSFDSTTINPQDFTYLFSENVNQMLLFKTVQSGTYEVSKIGDILGLIPIIPDNSLSYIVNSFQISKDLYTYPNISLDTSFISYNTDNTINNDHSEFELTNNFLLHTPYADTLGNTNIIVLKNQLLEGNVFASANNLLSGQGSTYSNDLREYTTISSDISEEESDDLRLNFVLYNAEYKIIPGSNIFTSPSSMKPFTKLNINDSKFISSGSFAHNLPKYADKVYHLSKDSNNLNNGQFLLCTWLSGSQDTRNKVWVDRYYYPDLIDKNSALVGNSIFLPTYDNYIESLISSNSSLSSNIVINKIFDKLSDLAFEPNETYEYIRISSNNSLPEPSFTSCIDYSSQSPINYFSKINESGEFSSGI